MSADPTDVIGPAGWMSLKVEEKRRWRFGPHPSTEVEEFEIGATGPQELQYVMISARRRATVKLTSEQARWLAMALNHWADISDGTEPS